MLCVKGVIVVVRDSGEWMDSNYEDRNVIVAGTKKTIIAWSVEGFCEKKGNLLENIENFL